MHGQELGDYLGAESCTDFTADLEAAAEIGGTGGRLQRRSRRSSAAVEHPPPIPPPKVPWVMRKHRTSDGRLVITEERAPHRRYFTVRRSDGRLVLDLIPAAEEEDGAEETKLGLLGNNAADSGEEKGNGGAPAEGFYIGVETCGGFAVAMAGLRPPVST